tara:strand:+ start:2196 stop:2582 length:387 start_codon:yes stop_codon:yes gene_type:complete
MEPVIVFIALFATVFGVMYVFFTTRNKERLAMIEKGADASLFDRKGTSFSIAKFILNLALLLTGIGIGIFVGSVLGTNLTYDGVVHGKPGLMMINREITISSMIFVFGGLGLIAGFFITRNIERSDKE